MAKFVAMVAFSHKWSHISSGAGEEMSAEVLNRKKMLEISDHWLCRVLTVDDGAPYPG